MRHDYIAVQIGAHSQKNKFFSERCDTNVGDICFSYSVRLSVTDMDCAETVRGKAVGLVTVGRLQEITRVWLLYKPTVDPNP